MYVRIYVVNVKFGSFLEIYGRSRRATQQFVFWPNQRIYLNWSFTKKKKSPLQKFQSVVSDIVGQFTETDIC